MKQSTLHYGSRTDVGKLRPHNEDSLIALDPLFAVADGMGGHEAGEVASEIAIETLAAQAPNRADARALGRAVMAANRAVIRNAENGVGKPGMGTTMTAVILIKTKLVIAQVGDSRAYLFHEGQLTQLTRDHSLVADLVESGQITPEEALWHPQRSVITRALGSDLDMTPDLYELDLAEGDRLLLCSDGLSGMVYSDQLSQILAEYEDPQDCADALIAAANDNGGHDNVTAIVIDVTDEEVPQQEVKNQRKGHRAIIAFIVAIVTLLIVAGIALYAYARNCAYLGNDNGYVAVYSGLPGNIGPLNLSWHESTSDVRVADLPESTQDRLDEGLRVDSLDVAYSDIEGYREEIAEAQATAVASTVHSSTINGQTTQNTGSTGTSSTTTGGSTSGATTNTTSSGTSSSTTNTTSGSGTSGTSSNASSNNTTSTGGTVSGR